MVKYTLFDIAVITGFLPTGNIFDPIERDEDIINLNTNSSSFAKYIEDHHDTTTNELSDEEHVAFLAMLLSRCIFCYKSLKVAKIFLTMANQLHEGQNIYLSQLILGSLYESLGLAIKTLKNLKPKDNLLLGGPYWLLQLWLNAIFETSLNVNIPDDVDEDIKNRRI